MSFVISINHANALVKKKKMSSSIKAKREASRNKFVEKGGMLDSVKSFLVVDSSKNCMRARIEFIKPIQNELRKLKNLMQSKPI